MEGNVMSIKKQNTKGFAFIFSAIVMICLTIGLSINSHAEARDNSVHTQQTIVVHGGQTLWSIGQQLAKPNEDVREVIYKLRKANHLTSSTITPGMKLVIPNL
jgi:hypothetical protein